MKKLFRNALLVLASFAAVGCANDVDENLVPEQGGEMVTVLLEVGGETRTSLTSDLNVNWSMTDQLRIEYAIEGANNGIAEAATVVSCEGNKATFEIKLPAGFEDKALYAVYPYSTSAYGGWGTQVYNIALPTNQPFVDGGFADGVNVSAAVMNWTGTGYAAKFVNMGGLIRIPVSGDVKIKGVKISALGGESMSGNGTLYNISEEGCAWDGVDTSKGNPNYINLTMSSVVDLATEKTLVFVAPAQTYAGGFAIEFTAEDDAVYVLNLTDSKELARAGVVDLAAVTLTSDNFAGALDVNLRGTYKTKKIDSQWKRADAEKAMANTIMTAEDAGFQPEVAPKLGQKYGVIYEDNGWNNMVLYFDVATTPNAEGMYDLINLQDRASSATGGGGYDQITHNASYYDPNTGFVYFDFIRAAYQSPGYNNVELPEGHVAGYGYSYMFYVGTMPSHAMVGNYTVTYETSQFAATPLSSVAKHIGTTIFDANTNPDAASDPVTNTAFGSPKDGQEFKLRYWWNMSIYFDLSTKTNADGTIDIVNLIDRELGYDEITHNGSYYNPATGEVLIDFVIKASSAPGVKADTAPEEPYTLPGYAVCARLTPAE